MKTLTICTVLFFSLVLSASAQDIHEAAERGDLKNVKLLLKANPGLVSHKGKEGETPLHNAAEYGKNDVVKYLIKQGARVDARDKIGCTPLHLACRSPYNKKQGEAKLKTVKLLIKAGADVSAASGRRKKTPLHTAGHSWDKRVALYLIKKGADVNVRDGIGWTPLHWAAHNRFPNTVKALIKKGADVNAQDNSGDVPLHWTVRQKKTEVTKILMRAGADPNIANKNKVTPLSYAQKNNKKSMVKALKK